MLCSKNIFLLALALLTLTASLHTDNLRANSTAIAGHNSSQNPIHAQGIISFLVNFASLSLMYYKLHQPSKNEVHSANGIKKLDAKSNLRTSSFLIGLAHAFLGATVSDANLGDLEQDKWYAYFANPAIGLGVSLATYTGCKLLYALFSSDRRH